MLKAVIFDFDGVIADTEMLHFEAFNEVLASYNIELTEDDYFEKYLGYSDVDCFNALNEDCKIEWNDAEIEDMVQQKANIFEEFVGRGNGIIKGVREFVEMLRQNGVLIGICSGATLRDIKAVLGTSDLLGKFATIVTADDVLSGKPDPEGYILTRERLSAVAGQPIASAE
ncbi:MAG TPA: HAD family phosphatase, partial [Sedimentisphaerales bacterium]|nr:HAD family phosphatase [Sedimentisphaerales bacterium]